MDGNFSKYILLSHIYPKKVFHHLMGKYHMDELPNLGLHLLDHVIHHDEPINRIIGFNIIMGNDIEL